MNFSFYDLVTQHRSRVHRIYTRNDLTPATVEITDWTPKVLSRGKVFKLHVLYYALTSISVRLAKAT